MKAEFIEFCRTKGDESFDFHNVHNCALAQFGKAKFGPEFWSAGLYAVSTARGRVKVLTWDEARTLSHCHTFAEVVNALS